MPGQPNLLIVHCHDLGQYLHCYGVETVQTPNLDAFAAQGVRCAQSFCTSPSCSPSRAALFTGRYPHSNGVMGLCHANFAWDLHPDERHLAQLLAAHGYATAAVGVVHETSSGPARVGYADYDRPATATEATDAAIARLRALSADGKAPFFLAVGFIEPHRLPRPGAEPPGEHGFAPEWVQPDHELGTQIPPYLRDTPGTRLELAELQGAVRHVDTQFGRLMAALRELGLEDDTLVIFATDHGVAMPHAKCSVYDPGISVACILRWPAHPGCRGGQVHDAMLSNVDYVPTILSLLGLPVPDNVQGQVYAPIAGGDAPARTEIFAEMTYHDYYDPRRCIRTATHKLIANFTTAHFFMDPSQTWRPLADVVSPPNPKLAYHPHIELYDLRGDPWEQVDLAGRPEYAEIQQDLLVRLRRHLVETADPILAGAVTGPHHRAAQAILESA